MVLSKFKTVAIAFLVLASVSAIGYGVKWTYDKHLDAVNNAVEKALLEASAAQTIAVEEARREVRAENETNLREARKKLMESRRTVSDLRRILLIDHDLDRLLQEKPDMILIRVNEGTELVLQELEELTQ